MHSNIEADGKTLEGKYNYYIKRRKSNCQDAVVDRCDYYNDDM